MPQCCSYCSTRLDKDSGRSQHRFPRTAALKRKWVEFLEKPNSWEPTLHSRLCGSHFRSDNFTVTKSGKMILKCDAVPTEKNKTFTRPLLVGNLVRKIGQDSIQKKQMELDFLKCENTSMRESLEELKKQNLLLKLTNSDLKRANGRIRLKMLSEVLINKKLKSEVGNLKKKVLVQKKEVTEEQLMIKIKENGGFVIQDLVQRVLTGKKKKNHQHLENFCLTLRALSPTAYKFVRKSLKNLLLSPSTIKSRFSSLRITPGHIQASIQKITEMNSSSKHQILCSLSFDEVHIRHQVLIDGTGEVRGYIDVGQVNYPVEKETMAKTALLGYAVALNSHWKLPVGFYLIESLPSELLSKVIQSTLTSLYPTGIRPVNVTFDGLPSNLCAAEMLGADFSDPFNLKPFFLHPDEPKWKVYVYPDPPHMLKLMRNLWTGETYNGVIFDPDGNPLRWSKIKKLHAIQQKEGLRAANKLSSGHIQFESQKMKVSRASQLFSQSIARALEFCVEIGLFKEDVRPLAKYLDTMDELFDLLNSKHPSQKGRKAPLSKSNKFQTATTIESARSLLLGLKGKYRQPIIRSKLKTGPLGFLIVLKSLELILEEFVYSENPPLQYLLTYRLTQDHLEIFFSILRACGGFNNNPNTIQLIGAIRKTLVCCIPPKTTGNCLPMDETSVTTIGSKRRHFLESLDVEELQECDDKKEKLADVAEHGFENLSLFTQNVTVYLAGNVCKKIMQKISCDECKSSLLEHEHYDHSKEFALIKVKQNGGLVVPSKPVVALSKLAETTVRSLAAEDVMNLNLNKVVASTLRKSAGLENLFSQLHPMSKDPDLSSHRIILIKLIVKEYAKIRCHHYVKEWTRNRKAESKRQTNNKNTLFQDLPPA